MLAFYLAYCSTMKMVTIYCPETSDSLRTIPPYIPRECTLHSHHREILRPDNRFISDAFYMKLSILILSLIKDLLERFLFKFDVNLFLPMKLQTTPFRLTCREDTRYTRIGHPVYVSVYELRHGVPGEGITTASYRQTEWELLNYTHSLRHKPCSKRARLHNNQYFTDTAFHSAVTLGPTTPRIKSNLFTIRTRYLA